MAGRENSAEGPPAGGGDDEFRSVEFDESFVRAAQLEEFSAQERMADHARAVRRRPVPPTSGGTSRQGLILLLLITLAFGTAIYLGMRNPYQSAEATPAEPLRISLVPLAPPGEVPGGTPKDLFAHSPAAGFPVGAAGVTLPTVHSTKHFNEEQVLFALAAAKEFIVQSALDPRVLTGGATSPVRQLLDPGQYEQFDHSVQQPTSDGWHAATGWMVRLDSTRVELADPGVRVRGTLAVSETNSDTLEVNADHVFVYAVRAKQRSADADSASLFTVRRAQRLHFDRADLREQQVELRSATVQAGPLDCDSEPASRLSPLLAGERASADRQAGTNPYADARAEASLCGVLPTAVMPTPTGDASSPR